METPMIQQQTDTDRRGTITLETVVVDGKLTVEYKNGGRTVMHLPTKRPLPTMARILEDLEEYIYTITNVKIIVTTDK